MKLEEQIHGIIPTNSTKIKTNFDSIGIYTKEDLERLELILKK